MYTKNTCHTYFKIVGNFKTDEISEILGLLSDKKWDIGDCRKNGSKYDFAIWKIGYCDKYDVLVTNQMEATIAPLLNKIDILQKIKENYDVDFYLTVVPTIYTEETTPCLSPSMAIIDFCHQTRTEIDIDMYLINSDKRV